MIERLSIMRMGRGGDGICDTAAGPLYIPYALPGESVRVDAWLGHPDRRRLIEVEAASPERTAPICKYFGTCGGCAMQHWERTHYRAWKRGVLVEVLAQAGLDGPVDDLVDASGAGRRRAVFHARLDADAQVVVGFSARLAHDLVAIDHCPILAPELAGALAAARAIAECLARLRKPLDVQATATLAGLDIDLRGSGALSAADAAALAGVAERCALARLTRHGEIVVQRAAPLMRIGRAQVVLPPGAFVQATAAAEAMLQDLVLKHCGGARTIVDLFCGVGPFALRLAEEARVSAFDGDAPAIAALQRAVAQAQGLKPIAAQTRDLFRHPLSPGELNRFDAVVVNPPRQGSEAQARALAASSVRTLVAVSCNPATFACDARILIDGGYALTHVTPVDQFLFSPHLELVAKFQKSDVIGQKARI
ncbi:MAG: methyltransferase [Xanthobacteraceae bacterium]